MRPFILKFGLLSGLILVTIPFISGLILGYDKQSYGISEAIGYTAIILSLCIMFPANRRFLAVQTEGANFKTLFSLDIAIAAISSFMFAIYNVIYVTYLDPDFQKNYYAYSLKKLQNSGLDPQIIQQQIAEMEAQKSLFLDPTFNFIIMFLTVFVIGIIFSLIAAASQKTPSS